MNIARILLDSKAVELSPSKPYTFTSGIQSPIYCDNRLLLSLPEQREHIVEAFVASIEKQNPDVIAGIATASIPWAALIAHKLKKPMIYIRDKAKGHGKQNQIEGILNKGDRVVVVEDLISTGKSSIAAVEAVREKGGEVVMVAAIFTYEMKKAAQAFTEAQCDVKTLSTFTQLIETAVDNNILTQDEATLVSEWNQNPEGWRGAT